jgi:hypothetical protein
MVQRRNLADDRVKTLAATGADAMYDYSMTSGGQAVASTGYFEVENPAALQA